MKNIPILTTILATTLISACGSNPVKEPEPVAGCIYADGSNKAAPEWVCGAPIEGYEMSAVGYADKSAAGPNFMKQMAATAARVEIAQIMKVDVSNMIKKYTETTGVGSTETVDRVNASVTRQITKESLVGSRVIRQMPTPTGGTVVLVGLSEASAQQVREQAIRTSMNNDRALWQKFNSDKAFDEMAEEISKLQ